MGPTLQLQGLVAELREGLRSALAELCELRQRDRGLEERLQAYQSDMDDKIMGLRNSLNTLKEELGGAVFHMKDVSSRQREVHKKLELLQMDVTSVQNSRKGSKGDLLAEPADGQGHAGLPSPSELSVIQHYYTSLSNTGSPLKTTTPAQSESQQQQQQQQRGCRSKSPVWRDGRSSREELDTPPNSHPENNKRQTAALELLESERVYVSYLSLLLKANISFNGSEAINAKDKRPFPSSLRFLIQQHLELLHTLQERILKCQWQGIMGDIFMKLTSRESDFLDFYVSYLKELPDCLSVVSMLTASSIKTATMLESEMIGDESRPSLHTLLLQPVQRIPEYLLLLQGLLRQTESEHPDYYLLLVCIQQFRSFTARYHNLLQHNQDLLLHNRKEMKRSTMKQLYKTVECAIQANEIGSPYPPGSTILDHANQVKRNKHRLLEQIQSRRYQDWDREPEPHRYDQDPFYSPEPDPRNHKPAGLHIIRESEVSTGSAACERHPSSRALELQQAPPGGSALAEAMGEFLLPEDTSGMTSLCEEDGDSLHNISLFDNCSSASSDSSIDIAFVRCPKMLSASHHVVAAEVSSTRESYNSGLLHQGGGYSKLPNRGCVSPDEVVMRHRQHRPLQASQRKSKSLNGLQLDSTVSGLDSSPLSDQLHKVGLGSHAKLERQGSKCYPAPSRRGQSTPGNSHHRMDIDKQNDEHRSPLNKVGQDTGSSLWGEDPKWKGKAEKNHHTPLSERSRKQEKGGFRSSFKKLFKKKSGEEKEKASEKNTENHSSDQETPRLPHLEIDRGTAV
ncbi:rho guanine nucleotide exchange factor 33 [Lampris incognitus]|uniref:rho guanine nucleotide exchange factor 33 n=1 Tax=Lampris incognitus TaxID=2546036 RepID=UPI0024B60446|nr:rho guanine nucleotide exchange factor 33 [Lampris incognitus]